MARRRVVILGGGVAGCLSARRLEALAGQEVELTLVARSASVAVGPWLPAVAAGAIDPRLATAPLRPFLRRTKLVQAEVLGVDAVSRQVQLSGPEVSAGLVQTSLGYDDLVVALGASFDLRSCPGAAEHALPLSGIAGALRLQGRLAGALDAASHEDSPRKRRRLATFVVVGSGPTACSAAGELAASLRRAVPCWPRLEPDDTKVILLSPGDLLPGHDRPLAQATKALLEQTGVEVRLGVQPSLVAEDHLLLAGSGERLEARTVIWASGLALPACIGPLHGASPRVPVASTLASDTFPGLWAVGACASANDDREPSIDQLAEQADLLARNLLARHASKPLETLRPPRAALLPLAPGVAAGRLGGVPLPSGLAWWLWQAREVARWSLPAGPSLLAALLWARSPAPALMAPLQASAPPLYQTPLPPTAGLPVPSILGGTAPLDSSATVPGLPPVTLPLPPSRR